MGRALKNTQKPQHGKIPGKLSKVWYGDNRTPNTNKLTELTLDKIRGRKYGCREEKQQQKAFPYSQPSRSALHVVILRCKRNSRTKKTQSGTATQSKCRKMFGCRSIKLYSSALLYSYDTEKKSLCSCTARIFIHMRLEEYCL